MKTIDKILPNYDEEPIFEREHQLYRIVDFTEQSNPKCALRAQQIQGQSYVDSGFVFESALDNWGRLQPELDRSRGDNVTYLLSTSIENGSRDQGSVRIIDIPEGGSVEDLAAYRYCKESMYPGAQEKINNIVSSIGPSGLREVSALSKTSAGSSMASFELMREIMQRAVRQKTGETWIITFAEPAHSSILKNFGPMVMEQIADRVAVDVGDDRTSEDLRLVPVLIKPDDVLVGIESALSSAEDFKEKVRLARSLIFMADGLRPDEIDKGVQDTIRGILRLNSA